MASIDPTQFLKPPHRPLKDIAADILCFPMDKPADQPFDSSMRVATDDRLKESYKDCLIDYNANAAMELKSDGMSLLDKLTQPPELPDTLQEEPVTASRQLAYSKSDVDKLLFALEWMENGHEAQKQDVAIVRKAAYPIALLAAQSLDDMAAESGDLGGFAEKLVKASGAQVQPGKNAQMSDEAAKFFANRARNIREGILPLVEELAAALGVQPNKETGLNA